MVDSVDSGFDFDRWRALADRDPEAFEAAREAAIAELMRQIPEERQRRLQGLQWRIDTVRSMAPNPTAAFLSLSEMMWDSFYRQQRMLKQLLGETQQRDTGTAIGTDPSQSPKVIPFRQIN